MPHFQGQSYATLRTFIGFYANPANRGKFQVAQSLDFIRLPGLDAESRLGRFGASVDTDRRAEKPRTVALSTRLYE